MASNMISSLPMYDCFLPYESTNSIWKAVREGSGLEKLPKDLDLFSSCHTVWTAGEHLGITQSCGYPLVREYSSFLEVIGTPLYTAQGCDGPTYRSAIIVNSQQNSFRNLEKFLSGSENLTVATNSFGSFSGWLMFLSALSDALPADTTTRKISRVVLTGSHMGSIKAVQNGTADIACIDGVSFALAATQCPILMEGIRVIAWGLPAPALPFVTNRGASEKQIAALRKGLNTMMQSTEPCVVEARQKHLLAGIDTSGAISFDTYKEAVNKHIAIANAHPETAALYATLLPGRQPRENYTVSLSDSSMLSIDLKSKVEDAQWPTADFSMLHSLRRYLARYLWDTIHATCCNLHDTDPIAVAAKKSPIAEVLTPKLLISALEPVVGKQLWPVLPDGGKPKMIFCSLRGVLMILRSLAPKNLNNNTRPAYSCADDLICEHPSWTAIASAALTALSLIGDQTIPDKDLHFSAFMGAGAATLQEYFPEEDLTTPSSSCSNGSENETADTTESTTKDVINKLWAADINLSSHLIRGGMEGKYRIFAYISAPRHNDRNDWVNLMIAEDEAAIEQWRDSRGHTSVRTHVAPWSYDHIRLHRGVLPGSLHGDQMVLRRTVFLGPVTKDPNTTAKNPDSLSVSAGGEKLDPYEEVLSKLRIAAPSSSSSSNGAASALTSTLHQHTSCCPMAAAPRGFERHVVYWADLAPHKNNTTTTTEANSVKNTRMGSKLVPGGVHITLSEFKAQLLDDEKSPFVTVNESFVSPKC